MKEKKGFIVERTTKKGKSLKNPLYLTTVRTWTKSLDEAEIYSSELYATDAIKRNNIKETCRIKKAVERTKIIIK